MKKQLTSESVSFASARSRKSGDAKNLSLAKTACLILAFCIAAAIASPAQTFTTLASFDGTDGERPFAGLVQGTNGNFYGTTTSGGANSSGTFFEITPTGTLTTLYNFCAQPGCSDGWGPLGLTLAADGTFYGITEYGEINFEGNDTGTIFEITPAGQLTTIYSFCFPQQCAKKPENPVGTLVRGRNGDLYGTASGGGSGEEGGAGFEITPAGKLNTLYGFCSQPTCPDGEEPTGLVLATNGNFYGTTFGDGQFRGCAPICGTVFEMTPAGELTTVHNFCTQTDCTDGYGPSSLLQARNGNLYGVTSGGVHNPGCPPYFGCGTVFEITPAGKFTTIYTFCAQANCADGTNAFSLLQATDGNFYGTAETFVGDAGSVFKLAPTAEVTTLYTFCSQANCADGASPVTPMLQGTDGALYGTTVAGGTDNDGVVFSLSVGLGPFVETTPTFGKVGARVMILGNNLEGATRVTFNGTDATITSDSDTEITTTVPTGATTGAVEVMTADGTKLESNVVFQVIP
jgi:uncharacterized repeat protein (TIGR03803 family)